MGFADDFESFRHDWTPTVGPGCLVGDLLSALDDKDRAAFVALLADTRVYATAIATRLSQMADEIEDPALAGRFRAVKSGSVQRHRRHECRCDQS